jgi:hypothetical protein
MKIAVPIVLIVYYALHQDYWNWAVARPLAFGFLPIGLLYHALYAAGSAVLMALLVRWVWPADLEAWAERKPEE